MRSNDLERQLFSKIVLTLQHLHRARTHQVAILAINWLVGTVMYEERLASHGRNQNNSSLTERNMASLLGDGVLAGTGGSSLCFQRSESLLSAAIPEVRCVCAFMI